MVSVLSISAVLLGPVIIVIKVGLILSRLPFIKDLKKGAASSKVGKRESSFIRAIWIGVRVARDLSSALYERWIIVPVSAIAASPLKIPRSALFF